MKSLLYLVVFVCSSIPSFAQLAEGIITYNEKINVHAMLPERAKQYKDMIPEFKEQVKELRFNSEISKYANPETVEEDEVKTATQGGVRMRFNQMKDESEIIYDIQKKEKQEFKDFMNRPFIIVDENAMGELKWKIGAGQKEVLGYLCQEAIYYGEKDTVLAWFSPQIPVSTGPRGYGNLPGMILEMDMNDGKIVITAKEIKAEDIPTKSLGLKGKGKKVSQEEFKEIVAAKEKEMQEMYGGNGHVRVRTRH